MVVVVMVVVMVAGILRGGCPRTGVAVVAVVAMVLVVAGVAVVVEANKEANKEGNKEGNKEANKEGFLRLSEWLFLVENSPSDRVPRLVLKGS